MNLGHKFFLFLVAAVASIFIGNAHAFPIATPGTEGLNVLVGGTNPIIAAYLGNTASYSNDLYLMLDGDGNPGDDGITTNDLFIFNNHSSAIGSTISIGTFAIGTALKFRLHVNNTATDYFTGVGSFNPDSHTHARVQENWQPSETLVSFEDLFNGPFDYNDLSFSFTNTVTTIPVGATPDNGVPEPTTFALLGLGLFGLLSIKRLS